MNILLTGATGFLGGRLLRELLDADHHVVCAGRRPPPSQDARCAWLNVDFATTSSDRWRVLLRGVDAVVNLVGIFRESPQARFETIHTRAPITLFDACAAVGVRRVVQVSALGADASAGTAFLRSKYAADSHLLELPLDACVVQPSLVFGTEGRSARQFLQLASLPLLPLPAGGTQGVQPVHVDDAARALRALVEAPEGSLRGLRLPLVGPRPLTLHEYLLALRRAIGVPDPLMTLSIPRPVMRLLARCGDLRPDSLLDSASWAMLQRGNTGDATAITALLGSPPREALEFVPPPQSDEVRTLARLAWLLPLLRMSLAVLWMVSGIVSLVYPAAQSNALLARAGVPAELQPVFLWGAALLDVVLGALTVWWPWQRGRRGLWIAQAALILFYSAVIALRLPEFWLHPYAPMVKNLPILAILCLLACLEPPSKRAWNT